MSQNISEVWKPSNYRKLNPYKYIIQNIFELNLIPRVTTWYPFKKSASHFLEKQSVFALHH